MNSPISPVMVKLDSGETFMGETTGDVDDYGFVKFYHPVAMRVTSRKEIYMSPLHPVSEPRTVVVQHSKITYMTSLQPHYRQVLGNIVFQYYNNKLKEKTDFVIRGGVNVSQKLDELFNYSLVVTYNISNRFGIPVITSPEEMKKQFDEYVMKSIKPVSETVQ